MEDIESVRRDVVVVYRSYHEAIQQLPEADRLPVYEAIFEYALNGTVPELSGTPAAVFMLIKPTLDTSRRKAENGRKGGKQNGSKSEANNKQNGSKSEAIKDKRQGIKDKEQEINDKGDSNAPPASGGASPAFEKKKPVSHKFGEYGHVRLTEEQHKKLIEDYGEQKIAEYIRKIDEWLEQTGNKPYKNFNLAIRNWIGRDGSRKQKSTPPEFDYNAVPFWEQEGE